MKEFKKLEGFTQYLTLEEQELYKLMYQKDITKSKIKELEFELWILRVKYKKLCDPNLWKELGITKQAVFCRREHLINKINRICWKAK